MFFDVFMYLRIIQSTLFIKSKDIANLKKVAGGYDRYYSCARTCSLCHCGANRISNLYRRCGTMRYSRSPNTTIFLLSSAPWPAFLEAEPSLDQCSKQSCTIDAFGPSLSEISQEENPPSRRPIT
ncbi:hypothetical protein TNCV_1855521 [Trichonephila clavipes]|nr:hypothetical protein TNCV_1855521 [Trichonephila clavipes]